MCDKYFFIINKESTIMKKVIVLSAALLSVMGYAYAGGSCTATALEKKLSGAAKNSFMKKCERDARATCAEDKISKQTSGAAKKSHMTKCVKEAVGH